MYRFFLTVSIALILGACSNFDNEKVEPKRITEKRDVPNFTRIVMAGIGDLVIHQRRQRRGRIESQCQPFALYYYRSHKWDIAYRRKAQRMVGELEITWNSFYRPPLSQKD